MNPPLLSVIVPVYNEVKTIRQILEKIEKLPLEKEIIVVDNCSTDGTQKILQEILKGRELKDIKVIYHSYNKGKGESVRDGINESKGKYLVIQDADLEYNPEEFLKLLKPLSENQADIALGARFTAGHSGLFLHRLGNKFLTRFLNFMFSSKLNDYATCYKMAPKEVFQGLNLRAKSFDIEVEIVCKALKRRLRIVEVPITYQPRSYSQGKKIRWKDGIDAIVSILKYRIKD